MTFNEENYLICYLYFIEIKQISRKIVYLFQFSTDMHIKFNLGLISSGILSSALHVVGMK